MGCPSLPDEVNRAARLSVAGPLVLQVESSRDVTKPERGVTPGDTPNRLLMLVLTDGRSKCRCIEHKPCPQLKTSLAPGTKIVLKGAQVKSGIILCDPKTIEVSPPDIGLYGDCVVSCSALQFRHLLVLWNQGSQTRSSKQVESLYD